MAGQNRQVIIINESGLYSLILSSKLESARRFKRWVTGEVLLASFQRTADVSVHPAQGELAKGEYEAQEGPQKKRIEPKKRPTGIGVPRWPDIKNKTFGTMSAGGLLVWDGYRNVRKDGVT